jgi:hypothetical protein
LEDVRAQIVRAQQETVVLENERDRLRELFRQGLAENEEGLVLPIGKEGTPDAVKNDLMMREKIMQSEFDVKSSRDRQRLAERGIDALLRARAARAGITMEPAEPHK